MMVQLPGPLWADQLVTAMSGKTNIHIYIYLYYNIYYYILKKILYNSNIYIYMMYNTVYIYIQLYTVCFVTPSGSLVWFCYVGSTIECSWVFTPTPCPHGTVPSPRAWPGGTTSSPSAWWSHKSSPQRTEWKKIRQMFGVFNLLVASCS